LNEASLILDMSASVTVARHLTLRPKSSARRASLFLTPTGEDLVLLAEDRDRSIRLDSLEMQYYRALAVDERLKGHFQPLDHQRRYGQSCRDITSDLPQELVALHAAIGSRAVRSTGASHAARITVWRSDREGNVRRVDVDAAPSVRHQIGEWTVSLDAMLVHQLATLRESKLPKETGGVLLGSFDLANKIIYIAHTIASPPDSEEWPTLYIRGCKGLRSKVEEVGRMTDGMLGYIGEWHSHPSGCSTAPSDDDLQVFAWLTDLMDADGLPAMMMIVGDGGHSSCFVGQMMKAERLLPRLANQGPSV
jgi:integrative and conjugative element protein (TIGR02256 family)